MTVPFKSSIMAKSADISPNRFKESTERLLPSDLRDEFIKTLNADCAHVREMAWKLRELYSADEFARRDLANGDLTVDAFVEVHDRFTAAEDELIRLLESIESRVHSFNRGKTIAQRVYVSHTAEGLVIQCSSTRKIPFWGI